jgi:hypothetical protein
MRTAPSATALWVCGRRPARSERPKYATCAVILPPDLCGWRGPMADLVIEPTKTPYPLRRRSGGASKSMVAQAAPE